MYGIEITREDYDSSRKKFLKSHPEAAPHLDSAEDGAVLVWLPEAGTVFGWRYEHVGTLYVTGAFRIFKGDVSAAEGIKRYLSAKFGWLLKRIVLQAFEGCAAKAWERAGFVCTQRDAFNPVYAHEEWDYFEHGKPDLLTMIWVKPEGKPEAAVQTESTPEQVAVVQALAELQSADSLVHEIFADYTEALEDQRKARFALGEAAKRAAGFTSQLR